MNDIVIWALVPGIRSINLKLKNYLNRNLILFNGWAIKLNPGKSHLINISRRRVFSDASKTMCGQNLNLNQDPNSLVLQSVII